MAIPDAIEKTPTSSPSVNRPASGTYGEKAALNDLKSRLPAMAPQPGPAAGGGPAPMPSPDVAPTPNNPGRPVKTPPGVPSVLMEGGGPAAPPVAPGAAPGAANPAQDRIALLDYLASAPEVSETTREWAKNMLEILVGGTRG